MKTVKELCLGVAVAGVVVGAGSALGCAVASASTDDAGRGDGASAADTSNASESTARGGKTGPARQASRAGADTSDRAPGRAVRNTASGGVTAAERVTAPAATVASAPVNPLLPATPLPAPAPFALAAPASVTTVRASSTIRSASVTASQVTEPTHVLLIGTDGTNLSKILAVRLRQPGSGFRTLMDEGVTGATSIVGHTTISGPSWSTILTGAWDNKTGVINNIFDPAPYNSWPTVFNLIEYNEPDVDTAVVANWQYINDIADAGGYPVAQATTCSFHSTPAGRTPTTWWSTQTMQLDQRHLGHRFGLHLLLPGRGRRGRTRSRRRLTGVRGGTSINTSENIKAIMAPSTPGRPPTPASSGP